MIFIIIFWLFFAITLLQSQQRQYLNIKPLQDWLLDGISLCFQGGIIPLLQIVIAVYFYHRISPETQGCLKIPLWMGFIISFVVVDYLYYWTHRLLHHKKLFLIHVVHHSISQMDILGTSRNTLWSSLFLPYIWVNSFMLYLLNDYRGYAFGFFLTCLLDLWRHSSLNLSQNNFIYQIVNTWLILPQDHAYHHSRNKLGNFAANLKIWDILHGTYIQPNYDYQNLGIILNMNLAQKLFLPFYCPTKSILRTKNIQ